MRDDPAAPIASDAPMAPVLLRRDAPDVLLAGFFDILMPVPIFLFVLCSKLKVSATSHREVKITSLVPCQPDWYVTNRTCGDAHEVKPSTLL